MRSEEACWRILELMHLARHVEALFRARGVVEAKQKDGEALLHPSRGFHRRSVPTATLRLRSDENRIYMEHSAFPIGMTLHRAKTDGEERFASHSRISSNYYALCAATRRGFAYAGLLERTRQCRNSSAADVGRTAGDPAGSAPAPNSATE